MFQQSAVAFYSFAYYFLLISFLFACLEKET